MHIMLINFINVFHLCVIFYGSKLFHNTELFLVLMNGRSKHSCLTVAVKLERLFYLGLYTAPTHAALSLTNFFSFAMAKIYNLTKNTSVSSKLHFLVYFAEYILSQ